MDQLNGFELVGRPIKVTYGAEDPTQVSTPVVSESTSLDVSRAALMAKYAANPSAAAAMLPTPTPSPLLPNPLSSMPGLGAPVALGASAGLGTFSLQGLGGLGGLAGAAGLTSGLQATMPAVAAAPTAPAPCFNLQNMFDPAK